MQDLAGLAAELRSFALGAEALLDRCLARIAGRDPALNSIVALDLDTARQAARDSDARLRAGAPLSPLDGIPLTVKDSILVRGMPATWGSRAFKDFVPAQDELPVARLRAAGAVILGKTNVPELTLEGYTANTLFGVTRNPWNPALTPGGSSGGAAASVAAGMVPAAIGTDGGGSIRRPASHTGLVGFKPSIGRYPRIGGFPAILTDFETIGLLTRTVADALRLDAVLAGPDARDRRSLFAAAAPWPARPRRILYVPRFGASPVDAEVSAATAQVAAALAGAGHDVREADVFFDTEDAGRIWHVVSRSGVAWLASHTPHLLAWGGPPVQAMAEDGGKLSAADYFDALDRLTRLRRSVADLFSGVDLVLTPTAAALPWAADQPYPREIAGLPAGPRDHAAFTGWVNLSGVPAISLPVALSASGLPIGVQLAAGFGADADLLAFAAEVAGLCPPPPLSPAE